MIRERSTTSADRRPATRGDVREAQEELALMVARSFANVATKDDLKNLATKAELKNLATKDDLKNLATKDELTRLQGQVDGLENRVDSVLDVVLDISKQLGEWKGIPAKVELLYRKVFRSHR
ncbi:MAG: hypothetical protein HY372_01815 [Candidatus Andersenbacteria bacterium]|nr:hypothetical protein [Candidatus Andersenbacteria bacterium]